LARLIDQFQRLPGIGPRTAQRLALHLLNQPEDQVQQFADALLAARSQVGQCQSCFHLSADPLCEICSKPERNNGLISPMDGIGPELLHIKPLIERIAKDGISEVILALTPSVEGDTTSLYLARLMKPFCPVSRIAYGLPMGSELEYADEVTLSRALEGRRPMD
jgi:recombination protein RecR